MFQDDLERAVQDLKDRPHFLISIQTGPWRGKGDWSYKVLCLQCREESVHDTYETACEARSEHRKLFSSDEWDEVL